MTEQSAPSPSAYQSAPASDGTTQAGLQHKPALGSPEWASEMAAIDAARESSKVYQLAFWPDDKRAMPGDFIACALFSCLQGKDSKSVRRFSDNERP
jgi:hypothetical protein